MDASTATLIRREAQRLAAAGQGNVALELLAHVPDRDEAAEGLRARILAQQGRFAEAVASWQQLLALSPENEAARRGLAAAERLATSSFGRFRLHARRWALLALLLGGLGLWSWRGVAGSPDGELKASIAKLERSVGESQDHLRESSGDLVARLVRVEKALADHGSGAQRSNDQLHEDVISSKAETAQSLKRLEKLLDNARVVDKRQYVQIVERLKRIETALGQASHR